MTSQILGFITASWGIRAAGRSWACVFFLMGDCCGCCLFLAFLTRASDLLLASKLCDEWLGWFHGPLQQLKMLCGFVASWSCCGSMQPCGCARSLRPHLCATWALLKQVGSVPGPFGFPTASRLTNDAGRDIEALFQKISHWSCHSQAMHFNSSPWREELERLDHSGSKYLPGPVQILVGPGTAPAWYVPRAVSSTSCSARQGCSFHPCRLWVLYTWVAWMHFLVFPWQGTSS